jgi:hypothetical protein
MAAPTTGAARIDRHLAALLAEVADWPNVAAEWDSLSLATRASVALDWDPRFADYLTELESPYRAHGVGELMPRALGVGGVSGVWGITGLGPNLALDATYRQLTDPAWLAVHASVCPRVQRYTPDGRMGNGDQSLASRLPGAVGGSACGAQVAAVRATLYRACKYSRAL